ncbi:MAG: FMN-binding protein [Eubacteriales bacterium]|nr:FMN-binding protein [Eubacteriales bacterium]
MKSKWSRVLVIVLFVAAVLLIIWGRLDKSLTSLNDMPIQQIDLVSVENGVYAGSFSVFPVSVEVSVTVEDHMITDIDLVKHSNGQGKAAEVIPAKVVQAQSLAVDAVSGATYSSRVILKAIENALLSAAK